MNSRAGKPRFATPDYAFGKEPNYFLKSCGQILPRRGRALAVADGEGRNGVWLAEQGLDVVSLDFSPSAQSKACALAAERGVTVTFVRADVHGWDYPQAAFDVVAEIFAQFSTRSAQQNGAACGAHLNRAAF
jgi:ubiquinone/menaquinone biosynthesis C-methylase UbiE